ncbi:complexin-3 [Heteronotia binoei]|uniref:complexin-3 n=1 Tax=Heteronotia binoei TaxID=13085 RepID=UPI00293170CF|nr:complexin-3 [Heteronotia binoei]
MAFMVKSVGGWATEEPHGWTRRRGEGGKREDPGRGPRHDKEGYEEYQKQLVEEKMERDAQFAQRKAERATLRSHFRDKYRLPKNETDDNQIQQVGGDVELPKELAKMIEQDNEEEEERDSVIGQLTNIQTLDLDSLKDKAQATFDDLKQSAEKCVLM